MSLREVLETVRGREKTLTVYTEPGTCVVPELREYFASQNVAIEEADAGSDPEHAVLSDDGEFLTAVGIDALRSLTDGSLRSVGESAAYGRLLSHLDRTTFTSYNHRQMLQASREIEDRAWRTGEGRLYAGFQRLSNFAAERPTYERLAGTGLDVHVYGLPDATTGVPDGVTFHGSAIPDVASLWFVVFDGGDDPRQACALLAEERENGFYGFWTYDTSLVDDALDALGAAQRSA
ncbi:DICT domain protein [Halobacterium hubeiense]|uniref:DICT domain protein n=1 Tax=Halobacterium hubeiense TaxID=1407499 RepID=A0A0U5H2X2_9EURY|nr:DICT sensory domain-containing protein [Halobacterium hubeiense]CQH52937.1 DICT domain protein [Halobacterium hubeiense]